MPAFKFFAPSSGVWTISNNYFTNNQNSDISMAAGGTVSNVTISGNQIWDSTGIDLMSSTNTMIEDNTITDNEYDAIALQGGNNGVTITGNTITDPVGAGVNVLGDIWGAGVGPDQNVTISGNAVTVASTAGIGLSQDLRGDQR